VASAAVMAAAAVVWAKPLSGARRAAGGVVVVFLLLIAANHSNRLIDVVYAKGIFRDKAWVEFARWNALSRVEVDRQGQGKAIVIDADASTSIMNCDVAHWHGTEWERDLMSAPPALANVLRPHGDFAIIGPGGGVDVLRAVANGSPSVTGIEINPSSLIPSCANAMPATRIIFTSVPKFTFTLPMAALICAPPRSVSTSYK